MHIPYFLSFSLPLLVSAHENYSHDKETNIHQENNHHWHDERQNKVSVGVQPAATSMHMQVYIIIVCLYTCICFTHAGVTSQGRHCRKIRMTMHLCYDHET